jgi:proline/betaine transport protein TphA
MTQLSYLTNNYHKDFMSLRSNVVVAGLFGNALEWYDFILYANFAPIIATLFFPAKDQRISILLTFTVFATGFLVRPFGALLFGYIGDHLGRLRALIISISIITLPTFLIGLLPTYNHIGIAAPLLLTLLRLFQGIAVSGELNSSATFLIEHAPANRRGLAGGLVMGTAFLGILIGAAVAAIVTMYLSQQAVHAWGWRLPFLLGGIIGVFGIIIRLKSYETPLFVANHHSKMSSILIVFKQYIKPLLLTICITCIMAVGNYIFIAYIVTFLVKYQGFALKDALKINLISMALMVAMFPIMGMLSDRFVRKPIFKIGIYSFIIFSLPIFWLISHKQFYLVLLGDIILCLILVPIAALIPTIIAELFPTEIRNTGTALGYNICLALFGGTAPLIAFGLVDATKNNLAPAGYLIVCTIISWIALRFIEESHKKPLL